MLSAAPSLGPQFATQADHRGQGPCVAPAGGGVGSGDEPASSHGSEGAWKGSKRKTPGGGIKPLATSYCPVWASQVGMTGRLLNFSFSLFEDGRQRYGLGWTTQRQILRDLALRPVSGADHAVELQGAFRRAAAGSATTTGRRECGRRLASLHVVTSSSSQLTERECLEYQVHFHSHFRVESTN